VQQRVALGMQANANANSDDELKKTSCCFNADQKLQLLCHIRNVRATEMIFGFICFAIRNMSMPIKGNIKWS